jgi:hypothetical protein
VGPGSKAPGHALGVRVGGWVLAATRPASPWGCACVGGSGQQGVMGLHCAPGWKF